MKYVNEIPGRVYRKLLSPIGRYRIKQLRSFGMPETFFGPLSFLFGSPLSEEDEAVVEKVEKIRRTVASSGTSYKPISSGLDITRTSAETASISSVPREWGTFLYLCATSFKVRTVLELGSSAGLSGAYLASAPTCRTFVTIEGSPALADVAERNIRQVTPYGNVVNGLFDAVLGDVLGRLPDAIDLVYIDGPKEYEATLRYLDLIMPSLTTGGLVIFDDIHWSREMWKVWQTVCERPGFRYTINVGRFGLGLWQGDGIKPDCVDLSGLLGWLRVGKGY